MSGLFRPEAVEHKHQRLHGTVILTPTWSNTVLTGFFCCIILALAWFATQFGFTRKETVSGMVVPDRGVVRLAAPQSAIVTQIHVSEGDLVRAGAPLFVLTSERTSAKGDTQAAIGEALVSRMDYLRKELEQKGLQRSNRDREIALRIESLQSSLKQLENERDVQRRRTDILRNMSVSLAALSEEGSVSRNVANQKAAELLEQEARLNGLDGQRLGIERDITALTNLRSDLPLQNSRDTTQTLRGIEELKQQSSDNEARRQLVVRAEVPGRFTGMLVGVGQAVSAEQRLASLLPQDSRLEAELYVPTRAAGFVRPGTPVLLRYDAFPYQKFGQFRGRVRDVSMTTVPLSELQQAASASPSQSGQAALTPSEPVYRVRVQIDAQSVLAAGHAYPIKPGMQLSATLVLEHRTLVEWVLEPVFGLSSRL